MNLDDSRKTIDNIDRSLVELLDSRARMSRHIAEIKAKANLPIFDEQREDHIFRSVIETSDGIMSHVALDEIYRIILRESRRLQGEVYVSHAAAALEEA